MKRALRLFAANAALVLLSTVLALAAGELAIRYLPLGVPEAVKNPVGLDEHLNAGMDDPVLAAALKPNLRSYAMTTSDYTQFHVDTNAPNGAAVGFRDFFDAPSAYAVAVGDSFTFGWGQEYPRSFVKVAERAAGVKILNFGVSNFGPPQYNLVLEHHALAFNPKVVVWQFFPNDFNDARRFKTRQENVGMAKAKSAVAAWLSRYSCTYKLYKYASRPYSNKVLHYKRDEVEYAFDKGWLHEVDPAQPDIAEGLALTKVALDRLARMAKERGFVPVVLMVPEKEQLYAAEFDQLGGGDTKKLASALYDDVREYALSKGLRVLDLAPVLEKHKERQIYMKMDGHFSDLGAETVGQALAGYLKEQRLTGP